MLEDCDAPTATAILEGSPSATPSLHSSALTLILRQLVFDTTRLAMHLLLALGAVKAWARLAPAARSTTTLAIIIVRTVFE
jgi:hypothetical protein